MNFFYKWNGFQKAAFICWLLGALLVVGGAFCVWLAFQQSSAMSIGSLIFVILIGIVLLATGGTLHQVGANREVKKTAKDD